MIIRSGTGTRTLSGRRPTAPSGPVSYRAPITGVDFGPIDRAPNNRWTTPRDSFSGKPGTPVRGTYPIDWEPKGE